MSNLLQSADGAALLAQLGWNGAVIWVCLDSRSPGEIAAPSADFPNCLLSSGCRLSWG